MRLTKYEPQENNMFPYQLQEDELRNELTAIHKLGLLEDLEEKLGVNLLIFVKAILIGFYYKDVSSHNIPYIGFARGKRINKNYFRVNNHPFYFKDYGKTWALTKEELK